MTWQFASVPYIHDCTRPLEVADELESFFYVLVYGAVRFLHSTCPASRVQLFFDGFFDHDYVDDVGWAVSMWKRYALEHARIFVPPDGDELRFIGGPSTTERSGSNTPINALVEELLSWFHARFIERFGHDGAGLDERHFIPMEHPPDIDKDPRLARLDAKALARKLADHSAILDLFERTLAEHWPENDLAGDRLESKPPGRPPSTGVQEEDGKEHQPELEPARGRRDSIETISRIEEEEVITVLLARKTNARKPAKRRPATKSNLNMTKTRVGAMARATEAKLAIAEKKLPMAHRRSKRLRNEDPSEDLGENRRPKRQCRR